MATLLAMLSSQALAVSALAAGTNIVSADFSGGAGTALVGGTLFAQSGAALTLTVVTDEATACVALAGAHTASATTPTSATATSLTWTFPLVALSGPDGVRTTTITASTDAGCLAADATASSSYTVDNTPPTLNATKSPPANLFNWNNSDVIITWAATDSGSGVASGPTPATDTQTTETPGVLKTSTATDNVGNVGTAAVRVQLDKTPPSISGIRNPVPNANGWNNTDVTISFSCSDGRSGIRSCSGPTSFTANTAGQSVTGTALDFASNTTSVMVAPINIDKDPPTLSGAPMGSPNAAGWYNTEVSVAWTCGDTGGSGFAAGECDNSTIPGDGIGLTADKIVTDLAGNSSPLAVSSPAVNIDRTPPDVVVTGVVDGGTYQSGSYSAGCSTTDGLSGVAVSAGLSASPGLPGTMILTCSGAVDHAGNDQAGPVSVTINVFSPGLPAAYEFSGFLAPVKGGGALNSAKAGQAVPIKFSLGGYQGMAIFAAGYPVSASYSCSTTPLWLAGDLTAAAGGGLSYDAVNDTYSYIWKTDRSWTGCRVFEIQFSDGSQQRAFFNFR